ncbi:MAG TPA: hypothetical protein VFT98_07125, partial [Myxococcota bacterium]|nr:hypothetical protein [Myxococcota bacterium]
MRARWKLVVGALAALIVLGGAFVSVFPRYYAWRARDPEFFADEIAAFAEQDRASPPPDGVVVFTGSSSIALWKDLGKYFPKHQVLNRGFGGSTLPDARRRQVNRQVHHADFRQFRVYLLDERLEIGVHLFGGAFARQVVAA